MPAPSEKRRKSLPSTSDGVSGAVALPPPIMPYYPSSVNPNMLPGYPVYYPYPAHPVYYSMPQSTSSQALASAAYETVSSSSSNSDPKASPNKVHTAPPSHPQYYDRLPYPIHVPTPLIATPAPYPTLSPTSSSTFKPSQYPTVDRREKARKVSHSVIERRRQERLNHKIAQLKGLIPSCAWQHHLHKMTVLQCAIDYIAYLKNVVGEEHANNNNNPVASCPAPVKQPLLPREVATMTTRFSVDERKVKEDDDEVLSSAFPAGLGPLGPIDAMDASGKLNFPKTRTFRLQQQTAPEDKEVSPQKNMRVVDILCAKSTE